MASRITTNAVKASASEIHTAVQIDALRNEIGPSLRCNARSMASRITTNAVKARYSHQYSDRGKRAAFTSNPCQTGLTGRLLHVTGQSGIPPCSDRKSTRLNSSHLVISYAV